MSLAEILQDQNPWWRNSAARRALAYPVRRDLQKEVLQRVLRLADRRALVLLGPRQVGKTVLLWQVADDLLAAGWPAQNLTYFDFSDDRLTGEVTPREVVEAAPVGLVPDRPRTFLLDEIRLSPNWARWLKQAVDTGRDRIVVTDSAASMLRDGARESGQGRWDEVRIEGLSFREFLRLQARPGEVEEDVFRHLPNLPERYLALGGFPEHALSEDFPEVRRRLRTDISDRAILRDLSVLGVDVQRIKDLFVYLVQDSGAEFEATARANDLRADQRSVREWARLLTETMLVAPLDRYARHAAAALRSRTKVYAADHGLVAAFAPSPRDDARVRGQVFEAVVFRHLREAARRREGQVTYFRERDELEIDFVVEAEGLVTGVEVTSSGRLRPDKVEKLRRAGRELGAGRLLLVHGGMIDEEIGEGVQAVALASFLLDPIGWFAGDDR